MPLDFDPAKEALKRALQATAADDDAQAPQDEAGGAKSIQAVVDGPCKKPLMEFMAKNLQGEKPLAMQPACCDIKQRLQSSWQEGASLSDLIGTPEVTARSALLIDWWKFAADAAMFISEQGCIPAVVGDVFGCREDVLKLADVRGEYLVGLLGVPLRPLRGARAPGIKGRFAAAPLLLSPNVKAEVIEMDVVVVSESRGKGWELAVQSLANVAALGALKALDAAMQQCGPMKTSSPAQSSASLGARARPQARAVPAEDAGVSVSAIASFAEIYEINLDPNCARDAAGTAIAVNAAGLQQILESLESFIWRNVTIDFDSVGPDLKQNAHPVVTIGCPVKGSLDLVSFGPHDHEAACARRGLR
ncbi:unnamed protein product, partial [Prorocentrum cordatum]